MSTASTLDQAREFLLLAPDAPAADVLAEAVARQAEWAMKLNDPRAPARLKEGAGRKLKEVAPLLPLLDVEVQLEELTRAADEPNLGLNQLLHRCDNAAKAVAALTESEAKAMLACRVQDIRDVAKQKSNAAPGPPPPEPPLLPDPALPLFETRLSELRAGIASEDPGKLKLARLLADANKAMSRLRDEPARIRAAQEIEELEKQLEPLLARVTAPRFRPPPVAQGSLPAPIAALNRKDLPPASDELARATGSPPQLDAVARKRVEAEHAEPAQRLHSPVATAAEAPAHKLAAAKSPAMVAATPPPLPVRKLQPGQVLALAPVASGSVTGLVPVPLRIVARPRFVIGRLAAEGDARADFSVPLAEKRVSRTHVTLTREADEILVADGEDGKKSSNGSKLDEEVLTPRPVPASFTRERTISLGSIFLLTAQHLPAAAPAGPPQAMAELENSGKTTVISLVTGCMKFNAKTDAHLPVRVAWIFTDASLGAAPTNAFSLPQSGLADTHARLHFWQGSFWIETLRSGQAVRIGDRVLAKGEAAPLATGDIVHLGQLTYQATVTP